MRAADIKSAVRVNDGRVIQDGDHIVWASLYATGGDTPYAILASVTLPSDDNLPADYEGWRGDWAAFMGGAPRGSTLQETLRYVRANGDKLMEEHARVLFDIEDIPYRP